MKKLFVKILFLLFTVFIPLIIYNYHVDFYGVFKKQISDNFHEPNLRFIKTKFLIENPDKYSELLFGSSRVGKILCNRHDSSAYNMYYSEGVPAEFLFDLNTLLSHGVKPDRVFFGLDIFSFKISPEKHMNQLLRMPYYGTSSEDVSTYFQLLIDPPKVGFPKYDIATNFDYANSGSPLHFKVDSIIERDLKAHVEHEKFSNVQIYRGNRKKATLNEIEELVVLCNQHNIEFTFFFNPIFAKTYTQYGFQEVSSIKKEVAKITPFIDYSGIHAITVDAKNYYESSHFRYHIGDSIWNDLKEVSKASFRQEVTESNIKALLSKEEANWKGYLN